MSTATQTIAVINAHLDENPQDWQARLELADLCEDEGRDDEARYQRWAVRWERAPHREEDVDFLSVALNLRDGGNRDCPRRVTWYWHSGSYPTPNSAHSFIQTSIAALLSEWSSEWGYGTRLWAEADLLQALTSLGWPDHG